MSATILSSPPAAAVISAHSAPVDASIQIGAVARDSSGRTWSTSGVLVDPVPGLVERARQVDRAVLLAGAADAADRAEVDAGRAQLAQHEVQRLDPHQRIAVLDARVGVGEEAVRRVVLGQPRAERDAAVDDLARVGVDDQGGQALRARIQSQESHRRTEGIIAGAMRLSESGRFALATGRGAFADRAAVPATTTADGGNDGRGGMPPGDVQPTIC